MRDSVCPQKGFRISLKPGSSEKRLQALNYSGRYHRLWEGRWPKLHIHFHQQSSQQSWEVEITNPNLQMMKQKLQGIKYLPKIKQYVVETAATTRLYSADTDTLRADCFEHPKQSIGSTRCKVQQCLTNITTAATAAIVTSSPR